MSSRFLVLVAFFSAACGGGTSVAVEPSTPPVTPSSERPVYDEPSVGTMTGEGTADSPYFALETSGVPVRGELGTGPSGIERGCGGDGAGRVFTMVIAGEDPSATHGRRLQVQGTHVRSVAVFAEGSQTAIGCASTVNGEAELVLPLAAGRYQVVVEGSEGAYMLRADAPVGIFAPLEGILSLELHNLRRQNQPDEFIAIRWDADSAAYVAETPEHPDQHAPVSVLGMMALVRSFEEHRDTFSTPVNTSDFIVIHAGYIAIETTDAPEAPDPAAVDRLRGVSDQWQLLSDLVENSDTQTRNASTYRGIRQSMENTNSVCTDPDSERCQNHRAWAAAYGEVSRAFRALVEEAFQRE